MIQPQFHTDNTDQSEERMRITRKYSINELRVIRRTSLSFLICVIRVNLWQTPLNSR